MAPLSRPSGLHATSATLDDPASRMLHDHDENPFVASLRNSQNYALVPRFQLESGEMLFNVPVAYTVHGQLSAAGDNAMVVCHALSGSADVTDWWAPHLGRAGRALDVSSFFIICLNVLASPYGTASPLTFRDGDPSKGVWGPDFPQTTIRDDVRLHKLVLDALGVRQIAVVVGGSMGGFLSLEWAYLGRNYVRSVIAIAAAAQQSAWCIGWGEVQRQIIYADSRFQNGHYSLSEPPTSGLGAARMAALLTYRTRASLEKRFGRTGQDYDLAGSKRQQSASLVDGRPAPTKPSRFSTTGGVSSFALQGYLHYQAEKFNRRFDSNCYIALSRKMDTHDLSRGRTASCSNEAIAQALRQIEQPTLIVGIDSDVLYPLNEQEELALQIPHARLGVIHSLNGHDAFLLEMEQLNRLMVDFLHDTLPDVMHEK